jgi:hypothetical protein
MDAQLQDRVTTILIEEVGLPLLKRRAPIWVWLRETVLRRPPATVPAAAAVDFTTSIQLRLRERGLRLLRAMRRGSARATDRRRIGLAGDLSVPHAAKGARQPARSGRQR